MHNKLSAAAKLRGILPPMATPFNDQGEISYEGVREQIEFMVEKGVHGVVIGGSTGEGHTLGRDEFARLIAEADAALAGRLPLIPGLIVNSTQQAIERIGDLKGMNITALQITPVHYLFKPGPEETVDHFRRIYAETGVPIIIYNVVPWNYLDVSLMLRIMSEEPGVVGMKQSNGDLKSVSDLLQRRAQGALVLSGIDALLYSAFSLGADGAITALTAAVPDTCVELWNASQSEDHDRGLDLHWRLSRLWAALSHDNLPSCVKYIQHRQGLGRYSSRTPMPGVSDRQAKAIDRALSDLRT